MSWNLRFMSIMIPFSLLLQGSITNKYHILAMMQQAVFHLCLYIISLLAACTVVIHFQLMNANSEKQTGMYDNSFQFLLSPSPSVSNICQYFHLHLCPVFTSLPPQ
jgi:hypothetical protein